MIINDFNKIKLALEESELLIFDFDGVLADSVEVKTRAFSLLYKSYGKKVVEKVVKHHKNNGGMSRYEKISYYHKKFLKQRIEAKEVTELANCFSKLVKEKVIASSEISGANNFLKFYCNGKKKCTINSATPEKEVQEIIRARCMNIFFLNILGSPSTKVDNLNSLLRIHSLEADKALFFGDAKSDLQAAQEVGVKFIGVGSGILEILSRQKGGYYHINDFSDFVD
jgi:phosphoglycolate phosphatase-like HAD superfamily hydrolase